MATPRDRPRFRLAPLAPAFAALAVALVLLWTLLPTLFEESAARQLLETLEILAPTVSERIVSSEAVAPSAADPLQSWATSLGTAGTLRLTVVASDGRVIADSAQTASGLAEMENHANRPEIVAALARGSGTAVRESATTGRQYVYAAHAIQPRGGQIFVVRLAQPLAEVEALRGHLARGFGLALVAALLAAIAVFWHTDRRFHRPLAQLIEGARELAGGRYGERLPVPEDGQLAALARALNGLSGAVESQLAATQSERDHLSSILASMSEGVLVVDASGRAVLANSAFGRLFEVSTEVAGRTVLEILRRPEVERLVVETLERGVGRPLTIEFEAPDRRTLVLASDVLAATGSPGSASWAGAVVVVRDATEQARLDEIRRDFVANVSHELKTPLAAIRGYAETLKDGALDEPSTAARFTDRILEQCRRLQALLDDLLTLSRLEGAAREAPRQPIDLAEIAREAIEWVAPAAAARHVEVNLAVQLASPEQLPLVGDGDGLLRLLVNLLANAVTYNREGGSVEVRLLAPRDGSEGAWIEVADTGIGIPPEAVPRLFERFYRVDKGRAREDGGTGLGLAIVKHVAQSHGGSVEVESRLGQGSTFRVKLPRV